MITDIIGEKRIDLAYQLEASKSQLLASLVTIFGTG